MSHALAVVLSVWVEVFGHLMAYLVSALLPAISLLALGTVPLALSLRALLRTNPCNCC